jgi:hypothetical protein
LFKILLLEASEKAQKLPKFCKIYKNYIFLHWKTKVGSQMSILLSYASMIQLLKAKNAQKVYIFVNFSTFLSWMLQTDSKYGVFHSLLFQSYTFSKLIHPKTLKIGHI